VVVENFLDADDAKRVLLEAVRRYQAEFPRP
jgi:hypothetical protein